jgi:hypothetical protein
VNRPNRRNRPNRSYDGVIDLLTAILHGIPRLNGLCMGRHELFDAEQRDPDERRYAITRAITICRECPVLSDCRQLAMTTDVVGVVAAELHTATPPDEAKRKKRPRPRPRPRPAAVPA